MPFDTLEFGHVLVPLSQHIIIFSFLTLSCSEDSAAVAGIGAPQTDVAVIRAGEEVFCVGGEFG